MHLVDGIGYEIRLDLCHLATDGTYLVTVTGLIVAGLIDRGPLETVPDDEAQLKEEINGIVERSPTDREVVVLYQLLAQVIEGEMAVDVINSLKNGITLRRLAMVVHLKIAVENAQYILPNVYFYHICAGLIL